MQYFDVPWFIRSTLGLRSKRRIAFDSVIQIRIGDPTLLLTHPDDVHHVLVGNSSNYSKTGLLTGIEGQHRAGQGLLTRTGDDHLRQRRLLQPLFHRKSVEPYYGVIRSQVEKKLKQWVNQTSIDITSEMADLTQSIIIDVMLGQGNQHDVDSLKAAIEQRRKYTEYIYHSHLPMRSRLPLPVVRNNQAAVNHIDETLYSEISTRRNNPCPAENILTRFMDAEYPDGSRMNDKLIRDEALTLTSAGHETVAEALAWSWYLLARHPEVEARLYAEASSELDRIESIEGAIPHLPYTENVLLESMRLYPPTWIYERVPTNDDTLPSGRTIKANTKLYLCPYIMHRHPRYFPDPESYDPERFIAGSRRRFRGVYFPFGDGPHTCIGETFAMLEGVVALASICRKFRLELIEAQRIVPKARITLTTRKDIRMRLHRR